MTDQEALDLRQKLAKHYGCRVAPVNEYCGAFYTYKGLPEVQAKFGNLVDNFTLDTLISKSCLLDRMVYGGEKPSAVPCPVHKGRWSGINIGWPGQFWEDGEPIKVSEMCQKWYDAGCRCFQHSCGCTTGWQPEETK